MEMAVDDLVVQGHTARADHRSRGAAARLYDLRHTYATFALRAGIPIFAVPRFMGSRIAIIDRHYGHLAYVSRDHAVALLTLVFERAVDAAWTLSRTLGR